MVGVTIEAHGLSKSFGAVVAVKDLSFTARPGAVTGFLGPNGAGKTTTMRAMLGLIALDAGSATFGGSRYTQLTNPSQVVGAVLDSATTHPACTARDHLRTYAAMGGHPASRIDEVMGISGVRAFAARRTRGLSTGMRQRLNLATALLGDPGTLLLDEPSNGLDPEGIAWLRHTLRALAAEGRTIMVSSHVLSEVQQTVDDVVVVNAGRHVWSGPLSKLSSSGENLEEAYLRLMSRTVTDGAA